MKGTTGIGVYGVQQQRRQSPLHAWPLCSKALMAERHTSTRL